MVCFDILMITCILFKIYLSPFIDDCQFCARKRHSNFLFWNMNANLPGHFSIQCNCFFFFSMGWFFNKCILFIMFEKLRIAKRKKCSCGSSTIFHRMNYLKTGVKHPTETDFLTIRLFFFPTFFYYVTSRLTRPCSFHPRLNELVELWYNPIWFSLQ